jgi:hypothetical protein
MPTDDNALQRTERLTILLTPEELAELRRRAGLASMSVWVRSLIFGAATMDEPGLSALLRDTPISETEKIEKLNPLGLERVAYPAVSNLPASGMPQFEQKLQKISKLASSLPNTSVGAPEPVKAGQCPHHKLKGELCYKCDPKFGNPVIA